MDDFTKAYIEAALWATTDNADESGGEPLDANYGPDDLAPSTVEAIERDCAAFQKTNEKLLEKAYESGIYGQSGEWSPEEQAGHDFFLSRSGHGAGFFDRGLGRLGDQLQSAAAAFGNVDLYIGDDKMIYQSGDEQRANAPTAACGCANGDAASPVAQDFNTPADGLQHAASHGFSHYTKTGHHKIVVFGTGPDGMTSRANMFKRKGRFHFSEPTLSKHPIPKAAKPLPQAEVLPAGHFATRMWDVTPPPEDDERTIPSANAPGDGMSLYQQIRPGDRVTIVSRHGQQSTGRAVMLGPAGWVLNMGGQHGTPAIASPENIVSVHEKRGPRPSRHGIGEPVQQAAPEGLRCEAMPENGSWALMYEERVLLIGSEVEVREEEKKVRGNPAHIIEGGAAAPTRFPHKHEDDLVKDPALLPKNISARYVKDLKRRHDARVISSRTTMPRGWSYGNITEIAVGDRPFTFVLNVAENEVSGSVSEGQGIGRVVGQARAQNAETVIQQLVSDASFVMPKRGGAEAPIAQEKGVVWLQRPDGVYWANATGGTYWLMPTASGDYNAVWMTKGGDQQDLGTMPLQSAMQVAGRHDPATGRQQEYAAAPTRRGDFRMYDARGILEPLGISISKKDDEYRVNFRGGPESTAYYTDDIDDAVATGKHMAAQGQHRSRSGRFMAPDSSDRLLSGDGPYYYDQDREMLLLLDLQHDYRQRKLPSPQTSVVYDRTYQELSKRGFIQFVQVHPDHQDLIEDHYELTDKGRKAIETYRAFSARIGGRGGAREAEAPTGVDLRSDVLYPSSEGGQLGRVFTWLTKNGMGRHFPGMPIGWYQNHQIHAIDVIQERAKAKNLPVDALRVRSGMVESREGSQWIPVVSTREVFEEADKRSRSSGGAHAPHRGPDPVDDPAYIIQPLYNGPETYTAGSSFGYDDEATAIKEAKELLQAAWFEGDYVRIITRDGDLVWDSRHPDGPPKWNAEARASLGESLRWRVDDSYGTNRHWIARTRFIDADIYHFGDVYEVRVADGVNEDRKDFPSLDEAKRHAAQLNDMAARNKAAGRRGVFRDLSVNAPSRSEETPIMPVLFRVYDDEQGRPVIALFPTEPSDVAGKYVTSYMHTGQHGGADLNGTIQRTRLAKPAEYASLKRELENMGYKLRVVERVSPEMRSEFRRAVRQSASAAQ